MNKKFIVFVDTEWSSWKGNHWGKDLKYETRNKYNFPFLLNIGAVKFDIEFNLLGKFQSFINHRYFFEIPLHTKVLTKISQYKLLKSKYFFLKVINKFSKFTYKSFVISSGPEEKKINDNLDLYGSKNKFKIYDIRSILFQKYFLKQNDLSSSKIGKLFKIMNKHPHCPLSDAITNFQILKKINFNFEKCNFKRTYNYN